MESALEKLAKILESVVPKKHQLDAANAAIEAGGSHIFAHATGTGKTLTGLIALDKMRQKGMADRALLIVPSSLRSNYAKNGFEKFTNEKYTMYGPKGEAGSSYDKPSKTKNSIISYELFRMNPEKYLDLIKPDTILLDEVHRARALEGNTYQALLKARERVKNVIGMTGSVVNNQPNEVVNLLNITMGPKGHLLGTQDLFDKLFVKKDAQVKGLWSAKVDIQKSLKNKDQLAKYLKGKIHYIGHEALKDSLPRTITEDVEVPMSKEQAKLWQWTLSSVDPITRYKIMSNLPVSQKEAAGIFAKLTQSRQVSTDPSSLDSRLKPADSYENSPKIKRVIDDMVQHLGEKKSNKVVVYGNLLTGQVESLEAALKKRNMPYEKFYGVGNEDMTDKKRQEAIKRFNAGDSRTLLLSSAGSEGLDLKDATMLQMLEGHYNPEKIMQAESRVRRINTLAHLPMKDREIKIKRYISTITPSTTAKIMRGLTFGMVKGDTVTSDRWIYNIAKKKNELNEQFRDTLQKTANVDDEIIAANAKRFAESRKTRSQSADVFKEYYKPENVRARRKSFNLGVAKDILTNPYMLPVYGGMAGNIAGSLIGTPLVHRQELKQHAKIKQQLLDAGKEELATNRHYEKILNSTKPMQTVGRGMFWSSLLAPIAAGVVGQVAGASSSLMKLKYGIPLAFGGAALAATAAGTGPDLWKIHKMKQITDKDVNEAVDKYIEKLRRKAHTKYKGSKKFIQEFDTKQELGIDVI